jgi:hypothetical protein
MNTFLKYILIFITAFLAGCATHFSSNIKIQQSWPSQVTDQTYLFEENKDYGDSDEFIQAKELIATRLKELGFTQLQEVNDSSKSSFKVELQLNSQLRTQFFSSYYSMPFSMTPFGRFIPMDPFYPYSFRSAFYPRIFISSRHITPLYSPFYMDQRGNPFYFQQMMDREIFNHTVVITIKDAQSGKSLFAVAASSEQFGYEIYAHIPYLVQSALQEFPGKNGKYQLQIPLKK